MPNWQPNWSNVVWNWGAANDATAALQAAASMLDNTAAERKRKAERAKEEWRGKHRKQFDGDLARMLARAHALASECRAAADRIGGASQRARAEQTHRERERRRWHHQKAEEERARERGEAA